MPTHIGKISIADLEDGVTCPHCTQHAKIYKRTINSTMAKNLIELYVKEPRGAFHHYSAMFKFSHGGDFGKLVYWGLVEQEENMSSVKKTSGLWRITSIGESFVRGEVSLPKYARVYNAKLLGLTGPLVRIHDALGKRFDYRELMGYPRVVRTAVRA